MVRLLLVLLCASPVFAVDFRCTVKGRLVHDGKPVAAHFLEVKADELWGLSPEAFSAFSERNQGLLPGVVASGKAESDADGKFSIRVEVTRYGLALHDGKGVVAEGAARIVLTIGARKMRRLPVFAEVKPNEDLDLGEISMTPSPKVTAFIQLPDGKPARNYSVIAHGMTVSRRDRLEPGSVWLRTGQDGVLNLGWDMWPGTIKLTARDENSAFAANSPAWKGLEFNGADTDFGKLELVTGALLKAIASDRSGTIAADWQLKSVNGINWTALKTPWIELEGISVPLGDYSLNVSRPDAEPKSVSVVVKETGLKELHPLIVTPTGKLELKVNDQKGKPVYRGRLKLHCLSAYGWFEERGYAFEKGTLALEGLPHGRWRGRIESDFDSTAWIEFDAPVKEPISVKLGPEGGANVTCIEDRIGEEIEALVAVPADSALLPRLKAAHSLHATDYLRLMQGIYVGKVSRERIEISGMPPGEYVVIAYTARGRPRIATATATVEEGRNITVNVQR